MEKISSIKSVSPSIKAYYNADEEKRLEIYSLFYPYIHKNNACDICILCDTTGSMKKVMDLVKDTLSQIVDEVNNYLSAKPRFACISFKDKEDGFNQISTIDFTFDVEKVKTFLHEMKAIGGGDTCEDLVTPMKKALQLGWSSDCLFICLVLDAPAHGIRYHDPSWKKNPSKYDDYETDDENSVFFIAILLQQ